MPKHQVTGRNCTRFSGVLNSLPADDGADFQTVGAGEEILRNLSGNADGVTSFEYCVREGVWYCEATFAIGSLGLGIFETDAVVAAELGRLVILQQNRF